MDNTIAKKAEDMKCTIQGCPGTYEQRVMSQTYEKDGRIVVVRDIPVEVCSVCGDVLMSPETARLIERTLSGDPIPFGEAPVYSLLAI